MTEQRRSAVLVKSTDHYYRSVEATELKMVIRMNVYFVEEKGRKRDALSKGLTYTTRKMDEFGRSLKHTPEELKAAKIAYYQANIETIRAKDRARNKQRK